MLAASPCLELGIPPKQATEKGEPNQRSYQEVGITFKDDPDFLIAGAGHTDFLANTSHSPCSEVSQKLPWIRIIHLIIFYICKKHMLCSQVGSYCLRKGSENTRRSAENIRKWPAA